MADKNFYTIKVGVEVPKDQLDKVKKQLYEATRNISGTVGAPVAGNVGRPQQTTAQEILRTGRHAALAAPIYGAIYGGMAGIQQAIQSYIEFDKTLTRIQMVSGKSTESMKQFAEAASKAGRELSVTAQQYAEASLIFYQQGGAAMDNAQKLAEAAIKLSNATGQAMGDAANSLTAIMNSFGLLAEEGEKTGDHIANVLLKLDQSTAASGAEISDALTRFAAVAAEAGVSYEEAAAQVATISSATRLSAETIGTALKTFYANLQEVKDAGPEAAEEFTSKLEEVARKYKLEIHPFGPEGELLSGKEILDQIAQAYQTMTSNTERQDLVATIAGKHQITQVTALLANWNIYQKNLESAYDSQDAANEAQAIYAQSIQAHLNEMANAWEHFNHTVMESESMKVIIDFLTNMIQLLEKIIGGQGGLLKLAAGLASIMVILNADRIKGFFTAFTSGTKIAIVEQIRLNALLAEQLVLQAEIEGMAGKKGVGAKRARLKEVQQGILGIQSGGGLPKSPITAGSMGKAGLLGVGIGAIGIASDISAGKDFGEAVTGNIGGVAGGGIGAAIGSAIAPGIGTAIGGMIGSQIGDAISQSILGSAEKAEKELAAIIDEEATKYQQNKIAIQEITSEYTALYNITNKTTTQAQRQTELKKQLADLIPGINTNEQLTLDILNKQIAQQEYLLTLKERQAAKEAQSELESRQKTLEKSLGELAPIQQLSEAEAYAMTPEEKKARVAEGRDPALRAAKQYQLNLQGQLSAGQEEKMAGKSDAEKAAFLRNQIIAYEALNKELKTNTDTQIKNALVSEEAATITGMSTEKADFFANALSEQGKSLNDVNKIIKGTFPNSAIIIDNINKQYEAQQKLNEANAAAKIELEKLTEAQRKQIDEFSKIFEQSNTEQQLAQLQDAFKKLGIPDSVLTDLQNKGASLLDIMAETTKKMMALAMIQSIAINPELTDQQKYDAMKIWADGAGIKMPTYVITSGRGYFGKGYGVTSNIQDIVNNIDVGTVSVRTFGTETKKTVDPIKELDDALNALVDTFKETEISEGLSAFVESADRAADAFFEYQDAMLTGNEKTLALTNLQSEISDALSETADQYSRNKLLEYEKELNALMESGADVSSARVQFLKQQVGTIKERIRLEKESNAQNKITLVRQAGGGFTYQFKRGPAVAMPTTGETEEQLTEQEKTFTQQSYEKFSNATNKLMDDFNDILGDNAAEVMKKIKEGASLEEALAGLDLSEEDKTTLQNDLSLVRTFGKDLKFGVGQLQGALPGKEMKGFKAILGNVNTTMDKIFGKNGNVKTAMEKFGKMFNPNEKGSPANTFKTGILALSKDIAAVYKTKKSKGADSGAAGSDNTYVIQSGDTLSEIAKDNNTTVAALMEKNPSIEDADVIYAGQTIKLDTGGYTGNNRGMAMLHEKELVLNKMDTRNILAAVRQTRSMPQFSAVSPGQIASGGDSGQNVVINANFPNVSSADEIKRAFASMSNNALQFNTRNKVVGAGVK